MAKQSFSDKVRSSGVTLTEPRKLVCRVLENTSDHPDAEEIYARAKQVDPKISLATIYRFLKALVDAGLIIKHDFGDTRTRYKKKDDDHHDHLICVSSGEVIEFYDPDLEALKEAFAKRLGYKLVSHSLELYGRPNRTKNAG